MIMVVTVAKVMVAYDDGIGSMHTKPKILNLTI